MKKFLDFTSDQRMLSGYDDPSFVPLAPQDRYDEKLKKLLDKARFGFKAEKYPYVYFLPTQNDANLFVYWHLVFNEAPTCGKNQLLLEAVGSKLTLEFAKALKGFSMISALISPTKEGIVSVEFLESKLGPKSLCFSHRLTHPVLGTTNPDCAKISKILSEKSVLYHVDITKALGESFFDLEDVDADFVSFDINTINSDLKGGVVFSKKPMQEYFCTLVKPSISFVELFLKSLEDLYDNASSSMLKKITLKMHLVNKLNEKIQNISFLLSENLESLSTKVITFPNVHSDALNFMLNAKKVCLELGGNTELPLNLLLEMCFYDHKAAKSSAAICIHDQMNEQDVDELVNHIDEVYKTLLEGAL